MTEWIAAPEPYQRLTIPSDRSMDDPGAYVFERDGKVLYVGMASSFRSRLGDHRRAGMLASVTSGWLCSTDTTQAAARLERALIWLLDPSENVSRPSPSGPLWAATLGETRPFRGWSWLRKCGHVIIGGRVIADDADITAAGCGCDPWGPWLAAIRAHVEGLHAELREANRKSKEPSDIMVARLLRALKERDAAVAVSKLPHWCLECEDRDREIPELQARISELEALLDRVEWAP